KALHEATLFTNTMRPLDGLFSGITDLSDQNKNEIETQLKQLTMTDESARGSSLQPTIAFFKQLQFTSAFFMQDEIKQLMDALLSKDKITLRNCLNAISLDKLLIEDNQANRIIKATLTYLTERLACKKSHNSNFFAKKLSPISTKRLQQVYDILNDIKSGNINVAEKTLQEIKSGELKKELAKVLPKISEPPKRSIFCKVTKTQPQESLNETKITCKG
ncbi:MAG: hypothetical protein ACK4PR_01955, partial [Gammaproteobacteria bacterium]